ncbi:hypothetical protein Barb4_05284 [Bacteroidales bacterium Barb4]|nr:hypothetical protein Barb4_05284 [Bacteroidales bacterium Barb4]
MQLFVADSLAYNTVGEEADANLPQPVYFHVHHLVGQAELRNAVFQYAADLVQSLKHRHVISPLCHIPRKGQSGRA